MRTRNALSFALLLVLGCSPGRPGQSVGTGGTELPVSALADSAERWTLPAAPLAADTVARPRLTLQRISPSRASLKLPLPNADPAPPPVADPDASAREGLAIDDELRPPIARSASTLTMKGARRGWVELDVRVDEQGEVSDAVVVEAMADSATQAAAVEAAYAVRFHPATQRGKPVAVWCRQRFEVGRR